MTWDIKRTLLALCVFSLNLDSRPHLDFLINLKPERNIPVNITHFFDHFILKLVENLNIKNIYFDRWQSLDQVQRLRDLGIDAQIYSLTYKDMDNVRGTILSQGIIIPKLDKPIEKYVDEYKLSDDFSANPVAELGIQLLTVRDLNYKMAKPLVGDDDIFRAFCLGITKLTEKTVRDSYNKAYTNQASNPVRSMGSVHVKSGDNTTLNLGPLKTNIGQMHPKSQANKQPKKATPNHPF